MEEVVAGLDIGTTSIKLVLFGADGIKYSSRVDHSGCLKDGREYDPEIIIDDIVSLFCKAAEHKKTLLIRAVGISTFFPGFIALDKEGNPLTNVISWMDGRGAALVSEFKKDKKAAVKLRETTGCVVHESSTLWKILWLKGENPGMFLKTAKFLTMSDFIAYKFTGKYAVSYAVASSTALFNIHSLKWDEDLLTMAGISLDQISDCYPVFHTEPILQECRKRMQLADDAVLVLGVGDGHSSNIGCGSVTNKSLCSTIGTSSALRIMQEGSTNRQQLWTHYICGKTYISGIATNAGSSSVAWVCKNILHMPSENVFADFERMDPQTPSDLIVLPFFDGERGPGYHQDMAGTISGITSKCRGCDIFTATIEGILFNLFDCYKILIQEYGLPEEIIATGGFSNSEKILQMHSDIFNTKIKVPLSREASAVGAAIICLIALGKITQFSDIEIPIERIYHPSLEKHEMYMKKYQKYSDLYAQITTSMNS